MRAKSVLGTVLVGFWLSGLAVRGQEPVAPPVTGDSGSAGASTPAEADMQPAGPSVLGPTLPPGPGPLGAYVRPGNTPCTNGCYNAPITQAGDGGGPMGYGLSYLSEGLSDWILYRRNNCCDNKGGPCKPLFIELYLRNGVGVGIGGNAITRELDPGWTFEGGARSLFFNTPMTAAWTVDVGIVNMNNGGRGNQQFPLSILVADPTAANGTGGTRVNLGQNGTPGVTIRGYNQTFASMGLGKEWYIGNPANAPGTHWRVGFDFGGRYGSGKMDFAEIRHRTHTLEGAFAAAHTDYEYVCGRCIYQFGFRTEWAYTFSTILQTQSDSQLLNFLLTTGVRY